MRITHSQQSRTSSRYYFYLAALACLALIFVPTDTALARSEFTTGNSLHMTDTPNNPFSDGLQGDPDGGEGKHGNGAVAATKPEDPADEENPVGPDRMGVLQLLLRGLSNLLAMWVR